MKGKTILLLIILMIFGSITILSAQENKMDKELTVDELYLLTNDPEYKILDVQAKSDDLQTKLDALNGIEEMIKNNNANKAVQILLINLSGEGTFIKQYEGRSVTNNYPEVRRRACTLLGKTGGESAITTLITILRTDRETMVLSEAAYSLGLIGTDKDGRITKALSDAIDSQSVNNPDSNFAYAVILALQKVAAANNGLKDSAGFSALVKITQGNYLKGVKRMALDTLREMKKYN